jgi:predicted transcriptional regulator
MISQTTGSVIVLISLFFLVTASMAYPVNYLVESGYPYENPAPPDDVKKLAWWELSLRDIIILSLVAFSPALTYPIELFSFAKIITYLGYRRITDETVLDNRMRLEIYSRIRGHPGTTAVTLAEDLDLNLGTVRYHLVMLELMRKITSMSNPGFITYFEKHETHSVMERKILGYMQNETKVRIFNYLRESPDSSRQGIADNLGVSGPAVTWHVKQLMDDHIIVTRHDGKFIRHTLNPEAVPVLERYLPGMIHGD